MMEYIIAGVATLVFTTILTIAGLGAAFILIPVFLALGIPLLTAMSVALLLNAISMTLASISYARDKLIEYKVAIPMIIAATILSPLGAMAAVQLPKNILLWLFAGFLVFAGSMMLFYKPKEKDVGADIKQSVPLGLATGGIAGFLGGLLGVGGGNFIVPTLIWRGLDPKKAAATTALVVVFSSFAGFLGHVSFGNMDYTLLGVCAVGSILGAVLGSHLMKKSLSATQVKTAIGLILFLVAAKIFMDLLTAK